MKMVEKVNFWGAKGEFWRVKGERKCGKVRDIEWQKQKEGKDYKCKIFSLRLTHFFLFLL